MQRLVLVTGPPASGKSTLAERLAPALDLPLLSKDSFKEELHGAPLPEGVTQREWSRRLSDAAWDALFLRAATMSAALIEGNIPAERRAAVLSLHSDPIEIFCRVPLEVAIRRLSERGARHPVHDDRALIDEMQGGTVRGDVPLGVGRVIEIGTDGPVDIDALVERVREGLV